MLRLVLPLALAASASAAADEAVRCTPDSEVDLGVVDERDDPTAIEGHGGDDGVRCRSSDGEDAPAHRSGVGTLTVRDADGALVYGHTDGAGVTTFRPRVAAPLRPPTFATTSDGAGGAIFRDEAGRAYHPATDDHGNATFHTDDGRVARCHVVGPGHTVCD